MKKCKISNASEVITNTQEYLPPDFVLCVITQTHVLYLFVYLFINTCILPWYSSSTTIKVNRSTVFHNYYTLIKNQNKQTA